ncbi:MAG TPA: FtsX-like permease family protein [Trueperaceae bacterium]|jgi:putative ABC transport system permease protein
MMLARKLLRDLLRRPGQSVALALVFGLGIAAFTGTRAAYQGLEPATRDLYQRLALPDLVASVTFAPVRVVREVAALPGVAAVQGRVAVDTSSAEHPGVTVRAVGVPAPGQPRVGGVEVVRGRYLSGEPDEALVAEGAAAYHGLEPGDTLRLRDPDGEPVEFRVVGVARQPEHLSMIPPGGFMAMPNSYLVTLLPEASATRLLGRAGGVTELALRLSPGADEAAVTSAMRELLGRYRLVLTSGRDLPSVRNIRSHVDMLGSAALVFPLLFLTAGALGGAILLARVVRQERGLIGLLRASGFGRARISTHYLGYTLVLAAFGAALGLPFAVPLAAAVRDIFTADLGTPAQGALWRPELALQAALGALVAGALAALGPAWSAARLPPAEAMRGERPAVGGAFGALRLAGTKSVALRMVLRNPLRRPLRTLASLAGVTLAAVLALAPALFLAEVDRVEERVQSVRRYDLRVVPRLPQPEEWLRSLARVPGVTRVEGLLEVPVDIDANGETRRTYALGLEAGGELLDLPRPGRGEALLVGGAGAVGERIRLSGPLAAIEATVAGEVDYPLGRPVLLAVEDAQRLLQPPAILGDAMRALLGRALLGLEDPVTAALLVLEEGRTEQVLASLAGRGEVARVDDRRVEQEDLQRVFRLSRAFIGVMEAFALLLGVALIYNAVAVTALERHRELATLRVLGFHAHEVGVLFLLETVAVSLLALLPAVPLALWVSGRAVADFQDFLPAGVPLDGPTLLWVALGAVLAVLLASAPPVRELGRLHLAEVVRERE